MRMRTALICTGALTAAILGGVSIACSSDSGPAAPPPLPAEVLHLEEGYRIERLLGGLNAPAKIAVLPDGRILFNELQTGNIRVVSNLRNLNPTAWASVSVLSGGERGLLGIAASPDFATTGHVYVMACVDGPPRQQVIRFTEDPVSGLANGPGTVIVDGLPIGPLSNSGYILFPQSTAAAWDGTFLISVGDTGDEDLSQDDTSLAGRFLRYNADGSIPQDNPNPASPEYGRGIRNVFGMTANPMTGALFAVENGPTADDKLLFIQPGRNFGWPAPPVDLPPSQIGLVLRTWGEVIAPTSLVFHPGPGFGLGDAGQPMNLFIAGYVESVVFRFAMSGPAHSDIDEEVVFLEFVQDQVANAPLDMAIGPDGSLLISTFEGLWRVWQD